MEPDSFFSDIAIVGTMGRPQDERGGESLTPETLIIRHCAPTLAALKSSSLVCLKCVSGNLDGTLSRLAVKGVGFRFFTNAHGCHLLFVYRPWALKAILANGTVRRHLGPLGYDTDDLVQCLRMLGMRLGRYDFPHEIGFFLGYPVEDVVSFIENGGRGYAHSGMWKMYHDVDSSMRLEARFTACTRCMLAHHECGMAIEELCAG